MAKRQLGFTLVELNAVLLVLALVAILALANVNSILVQRDYAVTKEKRDELLLAMAMHFKSYCALASPPQPTVASLLAEGWLPVGFTDDQPFGLPFQVAIDWAPPAKLSVSAVMSAGTDVDSLASSLRANYRVGMQLYWERLPSNTMDSRALRISDGAGGELLNFMQLDNPGACL